MAQIPGILTVGDTFIEKILVPYNYLANNPGKNIRPKMFRVLNHWIKASEQDCDTVAQLLDPLHNASLLIDDIQDGSKIRRGKVASHVVHGTPVTINAAHFIYFDALEKIIQFCDDYSVLDEFLQLSKIIQIGQGAELYWRDCAEVNELPTEQEYENIIAQKTTSLALMGIALLKYKGVNKAIDLTPFVKMLGLNGQILDDLRNLTCPELHKTKGFCDDITEGKLSFPVVYFLNNRNLPDYQEKSERLLKILKLKTEDIILKQEALEILEESGALEYTRRRLQKLQMDLILEASKLGPNPELVKLIEVVKTNM